MKQDEIDLMFGKKVETHPNRKKYLWNKWEKKNWGRDPNYTPEFYRIKDLIDNLKKHTDDLIGQVVTMYSKEYYPPMTGIIQDCGDHGLHFCTKRTVKRNSSYFLGDYAGRLDNVAYFDPHPNPQKIWNRLNFLGWKYQKREDMFHEKIGAYDRDSISGKVENGKYIPVTPYNPQGNIGDCRPYCPCKKIK